MENSSTASTVANNRKSVQSAKKSFNKRGLFGKLIFVTTNSLTWILDGSHSLLNVANSGIVNAELKLSDNENMRAYVHAKNKELSKKGFFGLVWSIVSFPFTTNKRSAHLGAYVNQKIDESFFKDCIEHWELAATKEEKKDMKLVLKILKGKGIKRKAVVKSIEDDYDKSGYPDVHAFFVDSLVKFENEIEAIRNPQSQTNS